MLLDLLRPSLLLLPTITAGGDTPCHYPTAVWFHEHLLPSLRLHGWYPGASLGHPLLLYYFPFPFLLMSALAPLVGMPVAFKLGTALGVFLLPLLVYASFRLMRLRVPRPAPRAPAPRSSSSTSRTTRSGAARSRARSPASSRTPTASASPSSSWASSSAPARDGRGPWAPAAVLALTSYAHGYAVLWAGLTASGLLLWDPATPPGRAAAGAPSAGCWRSRRSPSRFAGPALVPLLADWGWTTPFDDAWIDVTAHGLFPPLLRPLLLAGALALAATLARRARGGRGADAGASLLLGFGALARRGARLGRARASA